MFSQWDGFKMGHWCEDIDVRDFIVKNYTQYNGDESFLAPISEKTSKVWDKAEALIIEEIKKGIIDVETDRVSGINNFEPGYIDKENEVIVGLQTDAPLKRIINPFGGVRMVEQELEEYGYTWNPEVQKYFKAFRKSHNEGVFDAYTSDMRAARHAGLLTGLPDAYGRGRIIGDYRRIALYGIDYLIEMKKADFAEKENLDASEDVIQIREQIRMQIKALNEMKAMAASYGIDISKPASNAREAAQFLYLGYLAGVKENNGAATSIGRNTTFLDIYIERDMAKGILTEEEAQEIIDDTVAKTENITKQTTLINSRANNYQEILNKLKEADEQASAAIGSKNAIPNLLSQIMFAIPKEVQILSIQNTNEKHIKIEAQSSEYQYLGYLKAELQNRAILINVTSTSGTRESNDMIKVTIEGDLPY